MVAGYGPFHTQKYGERSTLEKQPMAGRLGGSGRLNLEQATQ